MGNKFCATIPKFNSYFCSSKCFRNSTRVFFSKILRSQLFIVFLSLRTKPFPSSLPLACPKPVCPAMVVLLLLPPFCHSLLLRLKYFSIFFSHYHSSFSDYPSYMYFFPSPESFSPATSSSASKRQGEPRAQFCSSSLPGLWAQHAVNRKSIRGP